MTTTPPVTVSIDSLPLAVAVVGPDHNVTAANAQLVELLGHDPTGKPLAELITENDRSDLLDLIDGPDEGGQIVHLESRPSTVVVLKLAAASDGMRLSFFEAFADDDPLDDVAVEALDVLGQGIVIGDGNRILSATSSAVRLFGRPVEELLEIGSLFSLFEPSEQERFHAIVAECARTGEPMPEQFRTAVVHPNGEIWPVDLWVKATVRAGTTRTYTVIADARERATLEELARQATHDQLTGLPNRYLLLERLEAVLRRVERTDSSDGKAALYFIDLDDFKLVNDTFGHAVGDHVLRVVAKRLLTTIRTTDTVARIGGDEFVVLCEPDARNEHEQLRDRLTSVLSQSIVHNGVELFTVASIGLCQFADGTADAASILARADRDMYTVKSANRAS